MKSASNPKNNKDKSSNGNLEKRLYPFDQTMNISQDPEYIALLEHFQNAEFILCRELLTNLETRYPDEPILLEFKEDLQLKLSLKTIASSIEEEQKQKKKKILWNMSVFAVVASLVVIIAFVFSFFFLNHLASIRQFEAETAQLNSLYNQAEQLLLIGQPQRAAEIIERIQSINPNFENLQLLIARTDRLIEMESMYQRALELNAANSKKEALALLAEIENEVPGLWDVKKQITSIETDIQITQSIEDGNNAYRDGNWDLVISAYEMALALDPEIEDQVLKEQLLNGYLNKIISMLDKENYTVEDIEKVEEYYRKAVSMTPQSRIFTSERGNLQNIINDLLGKKYIQISKSYLEDKNQNVSSIARAISYLRKARNINPESIYLETDMQNAGYYQIAFNNFITMNWEQTIPYLELLIAADKNYANGNASLLLFEAYYAQAKQYASRGLYLDALNTLEQAEILAWQDLDNLMKLFQVQTFLGEVNSRLGSYENAVSYYQYAFNAININQKVTSFPVISQQLVEAGNLASRGNFLEASVVYQDVMQDINLIYTSTDEEIGDGICLAFFAYQHQTTVNAILEENSLPDVMVITFGRKLHVPKIDK